jgi:predicted nucleic acid-binding protein
VTAGQPGRKEQPPLGSPLLLDACVVLSVYAIGWFEDIIAAVAPGAAVAETVVREALHVYALIDGERQRVPVNLGSAVSSGHLSVVDFADEDEAATCVNLALDLDDGDAASAAIAIHRGWRLATDDRKAIHLVSGRVEIVGTLDLLRDWADRRRVDDETLRVVFERIRHRRYVPAADHPHRAWWERVLDQ